jgi:hypothetical protein
MKTMPSQPYTGSPFAYDQGPPDALPSATNSRLYGHLGRGRFLGSLGADEMRSAPVASADPGNQTYPNELNSLSVLDDVEGNGIFDAYNTHGNIHPDAGVFADAASLPGYLAREKFFQPSEVIDVTTGQPVMYVPGNAFMLDPRSDAALAERALYIPGLPETGGEQTAMRSTVIPDEAAWAVGETVPYEAASKTNMFLVAAIAGLAIGGFAALMVK